MNRYLLFVLGTFAFAVACQQAPLYYSNQNQYFLHGLADADVGTLGEDWLANTRDPTPLFSGLVQLTVRHLHPWAFHVYHALLQGVYLAALVGLFWYLAGPTRARGRWPAFLACLFLLHGALLRWASYQWLGLDYPWYFQAGVAGQYALGGMLQPSAFGVFLLLAVSLFVNGRPLLAASCVALSILIHSTYLVGGLLLLLGFLVALGREGNWRRGLFLLGWAFFLSLPALIYVLLLFRPVDRDIFLESQAILVNVRIPHHCRPDLWFDLIAGLQIGWVVLATALSWGTRLFWVLVVGLVLSALLTLAQIGTGNPTLALLFPWRISVVLVPVATAVIFTRLLTLPWSALESRVVRGIAGGVLILSVLGGAWIGYQRLGFLAGEQELPLLQFVRGQRQPGDVYFLPVTIPDLVKATRGSLSSDFKPLPDKKRDARLIPVDLQRFRLLAEAPIYVDFKSIPYLDLEVREWLGRLRLAEHLQDELRRGRGAAAVQEMRRLGITHLVWPAGSPLQLEGVQQIYADDLYRVYRL